MKLNVLVPATPSPKSEGPVKEWMKEATELKAALDEHAIVAVTDPKGRITFVNEKFCAISGYSREELQGQNHRILKSGHHPAIFFEDLWKSISSGSVWRGEIKNQAKDGASFWLATTIVPFLGENGSPRQFVAIYADITEQKRIEAELARKLRLQGLLAELSSRFVALPSVEVDTAITEAQRHIVEAMELDRSTLWQSQEGRAGMVLTHCWQRPGWPPLPPQWETEGNLPWSHAKVTRGECFSFTSADELPPEAARDAEIFRRHGPMSNLTLPLSANGQVFGALAFATLGRERKWQEDEIADLKLIAQIICNVVGRQRAEERVEQLRTEIAHSTRAAMLGELTAALAHELNQPLTAILSNAQAARRFIACGEINPEEFRSIVEDVIRDGKRAGGVVHNLRAMLSHAPIVREPCSLNDLVREVMEFMHSEFIGHEIDVHQSLATDLPMVHAARVEVQQVLVNLMVNSVQAMKETPAGSRHIEVETHEANGSVSASISDCGHGIPAERLDTIFDPFFTTRTSGMGMGLAICRRIVEAHEGNIRAANRKNGGAVFSFSLPKLDESPAG